MYFKVARNVINVWLVTILALTVNKVKVGKYLSTYQSWETLNSPLFHCKLLTSTKPCYELWFCLSSDLPLCQKIEKNEQGSGMALWQPYFLRLCLWSSQPKTYMDRQWEDWVMTFHPSWAPSGLKEAMLPSLQRPAPGSLGVFGRGKGCVWMLSVHVCRCAGLGGGGVSGEMN